VLPLLPPFEDSWVCTWRKGSQIPSQADGRTWANQVRGATQGRLLTDQGIEEIKSARVQDKVGFAISRIETLAFRTSFDLDKRCGLLPVNVSFFQKKKISQALKQCNQLLKLNYVPVIWWP